MQADSTTIRSRMLAALLALGALTSLGCATHVPPHTPGSIPVERTPPPFPAHAVAQLNAVDGAGCGLFGTLGSYEGAAELLRHKAKALGADYVQVTAVKEPFADHECTHKEYGLTGVAYRYAAPAPAPTAPVAATPPATAPAIVAVTTAAPTSGRTLSLSARLVAAGGFEIWLEAGKREGETSGLALKYERAQKRLALVHLPEGTLVAVASEPLELDAAWHEWELARTSDRVSVTLDGKLVLLYAAGEPGGDVGFRVDGEALEIRRFWTK